ncbi:MAG: alpha/beta hydrolase [Gemmatimonas sp.]
MLAISLAPLFWILGAALLVALIARTRARNIQKFNEWFASRRTVDAQGVVVGAGPVFLEASRTHAVLLIHGFGDTPQSVRPLADALHAAGWTVSAILLPGHGRPLDAYAAARADDWVNHARASYRELRQRYSTVVVCGISMGAALSSIVAEENPEIPAAVFLAPYFAMTAGMQVQSVLARLLQFVIPYHANTGSDQSIHDAVARARTLGTGVVTGSSMMALRDIALRAQRALPKLRMPVLYLQSRLDNRLSVANAEAQYSRIGSAVKAQRWLTGCGHIITVDFCKDEVARQTIEWFAPVLSTSETQPRD